VKKIPRILSSLSINRTIPNLSDEENFEKWQNLEIAKHRLIYNFKKIGLDLPSKMSNDKEGLCFDFVVQRIILNL
jgi:hypothetical protein